MDKYLSPIDVWAIAFGCVIGWGAFVMPGTTFIPVAGPLGSLVALAICVAIMLVIGRNYSFLMEARPGIGGAYSYTKEAFGRDHAFLCSWFLSLSYLTIVFLNATALFVVSRTVAGGFWQFGFHYQVAGYDIYFGEIALSVSVLVLTGLLFVLRKQLLQKLQAVFAIILLIGVFAIAFIVLPHMDPQVLASYDVPHDVGAVGSVFTVVLLAPWAFVGFEVISLETSHFKFPLAKSWRIVVLAIILGGVTYALMTLSSVSVLPDGFSSWEDYLGSLDSLDGLVSIPVAYAAKAAAGDFGAAVVTLTAIASIATGIIGASRAMMRMLSNMAEDKILSREFMGTTFSIVFIMAASTLIVFLGRNALEWFVEITSFGAVVGYGYTSASAAKIAKGTGNRQIEVTGVIGAVISVAFVAVEIVSRVGPVETMGAPAFLLLAIWCLVGFVFYWRTMRQGDLADLSNGFVSGAVLYCLLFYAASMWFVKTLVSQSESDAMRDVVIQNGIVFILFVVVGLIVMFYIQSMMNKRQSALEREVIRAEEGSKAKSQFLFNMSHDIRTPMNAIIGYANLAEQEEGVPSRVRDYIEKISASSKLLLSIIDDVLEMGHIESGHIELAPARANLPVLVEDVGGVFTLEMRDKRIDYAVDTRAVTDAHVLCDAGLLGRVLQNLLSNACKFTPEGGSVSLTLKQVDRTVAGVGCYEVRVKDSGIGMSPEFAERVFEVFERERTSTASGLQGTGLGLAISKRIVDAMGGTIRVVTAPGEGSEFVVSLNLQIAGEKSDGPEPEGRSGRGGAQEALAGTSAREAVAGAGGQEAPAEVGAPSDNGGKRLLVVEDNEINREIMGMLLGNSGFQVEMAENGQQAVDAVAAAEPGWYDAVLMDIQMPVMDGYEATVAIRALDDPAKAAVPIVAVTANAFSEDVRKARDAGMDGHVSKPVDPEKLLAVIDGLLR